MAKAFGIIAPPPGHIHIMGMQEHRPIGAFSFLGRFRMIDFQISNYSNSDIDRIAVFVRTNPRSLTEHLNTGAHYNINSKRGKLQILFSDRHKENDIYNTNIEGFFDNIDILQRIHQSYVVIAPPHMIYTQNYEELLDEHIASGADITVLYHHVGDARDNFAGCNVLEFDKDKRVSGIVRNPGTAKERNIHMETYVMKKEMFLDLIERARKISAMYSFRMIVNEMCSELNVRAVAHRGYFAAVTDLKSYFDANLDLLRMEQAEDLFREDWPIYTKTTDFGPTKYNEGASASNSLISNGCIIEGSVENSVIGRGCYIGKGARVKNCVVSAYTEIGDYVTVENQVIDKWVKITHANHIVGKREAPGYIRRADRL